MTPEPTFPEYLDSTMLSTYKSCPYRFFLQYILNWKPRAESVHLHAGAAFAAGLEAARTAFYVNGMSLEDSVGEGLRALFKSYGDFVCPPESAKSLERTAGAMEFYIENYPLGADGASPVELPSGKKGIELSFAEPLPIQHPETGNPILYCGRIDLLCHYAGGVFTEDDKTTSSLGASWARQWDLRSQFIGYNWGIWKGTGVKPNGTLIRGVSILKTKYETQQAIVYHSELLIDEWFAVLLDNINDMIRDWKRTWWRKSLDHACNEYGGCAFKQPCMSPDPQPWLEQYFEPRIWNPITRKETLLAPPTV